MLESLQIIFNHYNPVCKLYFYGQMSVSSLNEWQSTEACGFITAFWKPLALDHLVDTDKHSFNIEQCTVFTFCM